MSDDLLEPLIKATFETMGDIVKKSVVGVRQKWDIPYYTRLYREKMLEWNGTTRILGKPDPIDLNNIFTQVYIWEKPQATWQFAEELLEVEYLTSKLYTKNVREDGIVVLEKYRKLLVLGKPGAGKTTFLKWVTLRFAEGYFQGIPIFISLKEMVDAKHTVIEQIHHILQLCQIPNPEIFANVILNKGNAVVMLDGLDEVQKEQGVQDQVIDDVRDFVRKYSNNRYLITCRTAALSQKFENFQDVEMADFTPQQIEIYIHRYFELNEGDAYSCLQELQRIEHQNLRDMAKSPLLLSLLCLNYEENGTFPRRRADLYEDALNALLKRWDGSRRVRRDDGYKQIAQGRKPHLYARIAYQNFVEGKVFIKSRELIPQIEDYLREATNIPVEVDGEDVLNAMEAQHGIIVERARGIRAFSHLTFQEYYTAKYSAENPTTFNELMCHITDPRWREVFLLTASVLQQGDTFFEAFLTSLMKLACENTLLTDILKQTHVRSKYDNEESLISRRWMNFYNALSLALVLAVDREQTLVFNLDRARALALAFELVLALDLDRGRNLARNLSLARTLDFAQNLDFARNRAYARALALLDAPTTLDIILFALYQTVWVAKSVPILVNLAIRKAQDLNLLDFITAISQLELPTIDNLHSTDSTWSMFRQQIAALAFTHLGLRFDQGFTQADVILIDNYIYATTLLVECLKLAVVSDREGIKNRLLTLPDVAG